MSYRKFIAWLEEMKDIFFPKLSRHRRLSAPSSGSLRRRIRERQQAERTRAEGERLARERREQRAREKLESQLRARRELATYDPWGRGGGGAPNPRGIRFTDIKANEIYPEDELRGVQLHEVCRHWDSSPLRRQRQTPLRLREDPQLYYTDSLRKSIENDVRYRQTPREQRSYKHILDDMINQRNRAVEEEIRRNLEYEKKLNAMDGPWGRPGPGGTTWRNPRDIGLNFAKSMGWTDEAIFNRMKGDQRRPKRSSLALPKVKRDDNYFEEDFQDKENIPSDVRKLPVITPSSGNANARSKENEGSGKKNVYGYKVKGKRSPKKTKFVKRLTNGEETRLVYPADLYDAGTQTIDTGNDVGKKPTPEETLVRITGGIELVPLLARRRRVGARTLPSSDVTRPPEQKCEWREMLNGEHLRVLKNQMKVRQLQNEEKRLDSAESVRQHHATWASLWGRPGHGAPQQRGRYARSNLARLLYATPLTELLQ